MLFLLFLLPIQDVSLCHRIFYWLYCIDLACLDWIRCLFDPAVFFSLLFKIMCLGSFFYRHVLGHCAAPHLLAQLQFDAGLHCQPSLHSQVSDWKLHVPVRKILTHAVFTISPVSLSMAPISSVMWQMAYSGNRLPWPRLVPSTAAEVFLQWGSEAEMGERQRFDIPQAEAWPAAHGQLFYATGSLSIAHYCN